MNQIQANNKQDLCLYNCKKWIYIEGKNIQILKESSNWSEIVKVYIRRWIFSHFLSKTYVYGRLLDENVSMDERSR